MSFPVLFLIAVGLSMDALAVAACVGLTMPQGSVKKTLVIGLYFGVFQAVMPLIGYFVSSLFADKIIAYDHWVAFALLSFLGGKMAVGSFKKEGCADRICPAGMCEDRTCPNKTKPMANEVSIKPARMLPLALATSIDALVVGVSFAFLQVKIIPAALFIGTITFVLSVAGIKIGNTLGKRFKARAELAGGVILVLIGIKILFEHLNLIRFF